MKIFRNLRRLSQFYDILFSTLTDGDSLQYNLTLKKWVNLKNNVSGDGAPTANDDSSKGYSKGSLWFDITSSPHELYRCMDSTVATAMWINTTLEIEELGALALLNTVVGTTETTFQIDSDNSGPKIKNNSGVLEARNADDDAYADFKAKVLDFTGTTETIVAHGNTGTDAQEIDLADGSYHTMTVTGDFTLSFTGWPSEKVGTVIVKIVNGGSQTITWPAAISGTDPLLQAAGTDFLAFWSDDAGTTIYYTQTSII